MKLKTEAPFKAFLEALKGLLVQRGVKGNQQAIVEESSPCLGGFISMRGQRS